jgi:hypothetical protein
MEPGGICKLSAGYPEDRSDQHQRTVGLVNGMIAICRDKDMVPPAVSASTRRGRPRAWPEFLWLEKR